MPSKGLAHLFHKKQTSIQNCLCCTQKIIKIALSNVTIQILFILTTALPCSYPTRITFFTLTWCALSLGTELAQTFMLLCKQCRLFYKPYMPKSHVRKPSKLHASISDNTRMCSDACTTADVISRWSPFYWHTTTACSAIAVRAILFALIGTNSTNK